MATGTRCAAPAAAARTSPSRLAGALRFPAYARRFDLTGDPAAEDHDARISVAEIRGVPNVGKSVEDRFEELQHRAPEPAGVANVTPLQSLLTTNHALCRSLLVGVVFMKRLVVAAVTVTVMLAVSGCAGIGKGKTIPLIKR